MCCLLLLIGNNSVPTGRDKGLNWEQKSLKNLLLIKYSHGILPTLKTEDLHLHIDWLKSFQHEKEKERICKLKYVGIRAEPSFYKSSNQPTNPRAQNFCSIPCRRLIINKYIIGRWLKSLLLLDYPLRFTCRN